MSCHKYRTLILVCVALLLGTQQVWAQSNGTNSSYSGFGIGIPADQSQSPNRSMGGVGQALRSGNRINMLNPASYSALDSLAFLFDVGMNVQRTLLKQGNARMGVNNTSFDFVTAAFRMRKNLGMCVGFIPYTHIGYSFQSSNTIGYDDLTNAPIVQTMLFNSTDATDMQTTGGLHQVFVGVGWMPFKGFSIGANAGFLWGNVNNKVVATATNTMTSESAGTIITFYTASLVSWKGDVGVQYQTLLNRTNRLTLGATVGIGHKLGGDATVIQSINGNSDSLYTSRAYQIPMTYSVGAAWEWAEKLTLAADFGFEQWGDCTTPQLNAKGTAYEPQLGELQNRMKVNVGAEYVPARYDRSFLHRVHYRVGAFYSSPYLKINGLDGPREFGLTAGVGLPITNSINNRSYVHVGVQWTRRQPKYTSIMMREDILQVNIGLTFNEQWFMKWKFK